MGQAAGMRPDHVAIDHSDFGVRRRRVLVVEVERARHAGERPGHEDGQHQSSNKPEMHI